MIRGHQVPEAHSFPADRHHPGQLQLGGSVGDHLGADGVECPTGCLPGHVSALRRVQQWSGQWTCRASSLRPEVRFFILKYEN